MKKIVLSLLLAAVSMPCAAQSSDLQNLQTWALQQQYQAGTASPVVGKFFKNTYASTSWDVISIGQSGINIAKATAKDYVDIGPCMDVATGRITRYGATVILHIGNIWNDFTARLPENIADHVYLASIPNVQVGAQFLAPVNRPVSKATLADDFMINIGYRFGGSLRKEGT